MKPILTLNNPTAEPFLNEDYHVEVTQGENLVSRVEFKRTPDHYPLRFPFPKDNAIRAFHKARASLDAGLTIELWRSTPALVCCLRADAKTLEVFPQ